ncbi:hypothetical protein ABPG72_018280 [Tetrahymena utriculariae]
MNYQLGERQQLHSSQISSQAEMGIQLNLNNVYEQLRGGKDELKQLIRSVTFFHKGEDPILQARYYQKIEECLKYHFVPKDSFLFHHEQQSDYFYIILKGKCSVLIPKKQNEIKSEISYLKEMSNIQAAIKLCQNDKEFYTASIYQQKQNQVQKKLDELRSEQLITIVKEQSRSIQEIYISQINKNICKYKVALTLYQGDYFGESAFSAMPKRNGSILVNEDTHFALLNREDFLRIFQNEIINQSVSKQQLTKLFPHLHSKKINILNSFVEEIELIKNQVVFSQSQKSDGFIYIVQKGEFEVRFNKTQSKSVIKNIQDNLIEEQLFKYNKQLEIPLLSLIEGEIFGIEDLNRDYKSFSVICSSVKGNLVRFRMALLQQLEDFESIKIVKQLGQQRYERIQNKIEQQIIQKFNILSIQKIDNFRNSFTQTKSQLNILKKMDRCNTTISPTQKSISRNQVNKSLVNIQEVKQDEFYDQNSISLSKNQNSLEDQDLADEMQNFKQQPSRFEISMRIRAQKFKRQTIRKETNAQQKGQIQSKSPEMKSINTFNSQNQFNNNSNSLLSDYLFNVPLNLKKDNSIDNESPEQKILKTDVQRSSQKSRIMINASQTISPLRITSVQFVRDGSQCSEVYVSKSQLKSSSLTPIKSVQPAISQQSYIEQQEFLLTTPKRVHPKQILHQLKVKPMHKNHFSIFSKDQFDEMCVKSDLKPSLNPVMMKKRAKLELQSKSIYRGIKQQNFLRSSSNIAKELINKTLLSPDKNQKQQIENNKVRSISSSMTIGHNEMSSSRLNDSITLSIPKSRKQIQNYRLQMIDQNRKQKIQSYDFPNLLQNQALTNYFNQNLYPSYLPCNFNQSAYYQNLSPSKIAKSSNTPINTLYENRSFQILQE